MDVEEEEFLSADSEAYDSAASEDVPWEMLLLRRVLRKSDIAKIDRILESYDMGPMGVNTRFVSKAGLHAKVFNVLHLAIMFDHFPAVEYLLRRPDIDVNMPSLQYLGNETMTPLQHACTSSDDAVRVIEMLLNHPDIDINKKNENGRTVVDIASHGDLRTILSDPRLDPSYISENLLRTLREASNQQTPEVDRSFVRVLHLISHPATDVNAVDTHGQSAIFYLNILRFGLFYPIFRKYFLNDRRVILSLRDNRGMTVKEDFEVDDNSMIEQNGTMVLKSTIKVNNLAMIREGEKNRVRWAWEKVSILENWSIEPHSRVLDDGVLQRYVLPFLVEDLVSPVHEVLQEFDGRIPLPLPCVYPFK